MQLLFLQYGDIVTKKDKEKKLTELTEKRNNLEINSRWLLYKGGISNVKEVLQKMDEEIKALKDELKQL